MSNFVVPFALEFQTKNVVTPAHAHKHHDYQCTVCKKSVIVRDGDIRTKHFAHKCFRSGEKCLETRKNNGGCGEGFYHSTAKLALKRWLSDAENEIFCQSKCKHCHDVTNKKLQDLVRWTAVKTEYSFENERYDICLIRDQTPVFVVEILDTHKQDNRKFPWVEFHASDIVDILNKVETHPVGPVRIKLVNQRTDYVCRHDCPPMYELAKQLGHFRPEKSNPQWVLKGARSSDPRWAEFVVRKRCLRCDQNHVEASSFRPFCRACYFDTKKSTPSINPFPEFAKLTNEQIAYELEYMFYDFKNTAETNLQHLARCSCMGKQKYQTWFSTSGLDTEDRRAKALWNEFLFRKSCIRCEARCDTLWRKPYCYDCYGEIHDGLDNEETPYTADFIRQSRMFWDNALYGILRLDSRPKSCSSCHEPKLLSTIFYFGKRFICDDCLETRVVETKKAHPELRFWPEKTDFTRE